MAKRILVTGGAGFIGSNFTRYILEKYTNYHVSVLDNLTYAGNPENFNNGVRNSNRFSFWYGNVKNPEIVYSLMSEADVVVHMAAETHVARSIYDNSIFFETDVIGTQTMANALLKCRNVERFIHISTSEVYGSAGTDSMTEEHPLNPTTPYASAKTGADRLIYSYHATYKVPTIIVRPFNNYGPYQHLEKVIPRFITSALLDEPLTIHGTGKSTRDWLFVLDHCSALDKLIHAPLDRVVGQTINLGTGRDTGIETIAHIILERLGKSKALISHVGDRPGQVDRHISSKDKARDLIGWESQTDLEQGLVQTIQWYKENRKWWEKMLWMRTVPTKTADGRIEYH
jgi:dTDP-glucose 4,6-dehydratase